MNESKLLAATREALRHRPRTLTLGQISNDTGISVRWLSKISASDDVAPSVQITELLYEYLTKRKLDV